MIALNLVVQPKGRAAYILADTAYTSPGGEVVELGSKIVQGGARFPWALGVTGNVHPVSIGRELLKVGVGSLKQLEKRLAPAMRRAIAWTEREKPDTPVVTCCVRGAAWDFVRKRPIGFTMMSHPEHYMGTVPAEPFVYYETDWALSEGYTIADADLATLIDYTDPASFRADVDGLALLESQRSRPMEGTVPGINLDCLHRIGGEAHLVTVTKHGVLIQGLREWPDKVGQVISV